jgi:inhibitor of cysteine peptidase
LPTVTLTPADDGRAITAGLDDEIMIQLLENPTTGFIWKMERAEGPIELIGEDQRPEAPVQFGSGGTRELRFRGTAPGTARVELKHWRPWEGEASVVDRLRVTIEFTGCPDARGDSSANAKTCC